MTTLIVDLVLLAAWMPGWFVGSRIALAAMMNARVANCAKHIDLPYASYCQKHGCARPVGQVRERTVADGVKALGLGVLWPALILSHWVMQSTPLTDGEKDRRLREQQSQLDAQSEQIAKLASRIDFTPRRNP